MSQLLADVHYWTYHPANKPVAIFIHGFTGSHEGFQYIIPELTHLKIIVPDLPGFGESLRHPEDITIDDLAKRVNEFIKALHLPQPPYLVSHSMGGLVAASMLSQNPELFHEKTVFVSPVATRVTTFDSRKIGELLGRLQFFLGYVLPIAGPRFVKSKLFSRIATRVIMTTKEPMLRKQIYEHHFKNLDFISSIKFYYQLHKDINKKGAVDYAPRLQKFHNLIITGDADNVTPLATEKKLHTAIGGQLYIIKGVGHLLHYERPKEVAAAIGAYLRS